MLLFSLPAAALYALFVLWPMLRVAWLALMRTRGFSPVGFAGLANFSSLWRDDLFRLSVQHTLLWDLAAMLIPTVLALGIALLARRARGRSLALGVLVFPLLLPPTAVAAIWTLVYSPASGLIAAVLGALGLGSGPAWLGDSHLAFGSLFVAWLWSVLGGGSAVLWAALRGIGAEWWEIAALEGAGSLWRFRHIILPGVRRPLVAVLLLNAALGNMVFDLVFVTTGGGPGYATVIVPLDVYGRTFNGQAGAGAAAACIQLALGLVLAVAFAALLRLEGTPLTHEGSTWGITTSLPLTLSLAGAAGIVALPLLWLVPLALATGPNLAITGGLGFASWGWSNLSAAWNAGMGQALGTSALLAVLVVSAVLLLAAPPAFGLARYAGRGWRSVVGALLLAGLFSATSALLVPLFTLLGDLGLLDTLWGVMLPEVARALPFAILTLWAFLSTAPGEVLEAAEVDGASPLRQLRSVALPLIRPALVAVAVWTFAGSWNEYLLPTLVSQSQSIVTIPTLLGAFIGKYNTQMGPLAAGCLLAVLPPLAVYLSLSGRAARGLAGLGAPLR